MLAMNNETMNPTAAVDLLDKVVANYQGTRQDHLQIQEAVLVLRSLVSEHTQPEPGLTEQDEMIGIEFEPEDKSKAVDKAEAPE